MSNSGEQLNTSYPVNQIVGYHRKIEGELERFLRQHIPARSALLVNPLFYQSAYDYVLRPSKRLVPLVYLLTHEIFDQSTIRGNMSVLSVATMLEIRHAAILIHDDVADKDERRGPLLTAHKALEQQGYGDDGPSAALFLADALFASAEMAIVEADIESTLKVRVFQYLLDYTARTAEGQADELFLTNRYSVEEMPKEKLSEVYIAKMR
jgi:geranylgeranyl pyrophosphate synthase